VSFVYLFIFGYQLACHLLREYLLNFAYINGYVWRGCIAQPEGNLCDSESWLFLIFVSEMPTVSANVPTNHLLLRLLMILTNAEQFSILYFEARLCPTWLHS